MNALVRAVCGSASAPREWRRSLGRERRAFRSAIIRSSLTGVGARFGGALVGEALIGTLSDRLARSLQGLDVPPTADVAETPSVRGAVQVVGASPPMRRVDPSERVDAPSGVRHAAPAVDVPESRAWVSHVPRTDRQPVGGAANIESQRTRAFVDAVLDERGAQIVRAVGLDAPREREIVRASPLDAALRRYWTASSRAAGEPAMRPAAPASASREHHIAPVHSSTEMRHRSTVPATEPSVARPPLASPDSPVPQEPRGWWSTRVDAIHSRTESFTPAPARPSAARFDDDAIDESAFADALAEVLHRQARAYGVVVP